MADQVGHDGEGVGDDGEVVGRAAKRAQISLLIWLDRYFWDFAIFAAMKELRNMILMLAVCLAASCIKEKPSGADLGAGDRIPDFAVMMNDGTVVATEQLREGISCIVFFTTLCPDCQQTLPHIQQIYDEYQSQGVQFAPISREEEEYSIQKYWESKGYTMPYSAQKDRRVYELFAKTRVPRVYICQDGIIKLVFTDTPTPSYEDLKGGLSVLVGRQD